MVQAIERLFGDRFAGAWLENEGIVVAIVGAASEDESRARSLDGSLDVRVIDAVYSYRQLIAFSDRAASELRARGLRIHSSYP